MFNDNFIEKRNTKGIRIETRKRGSTLSIESVQGYHAGNYSCQATNHADTVSATTELAVKGSLQNQSTASLLHAWFIHSP